MAGPSNALLAAIAQGAQPRMADAMSRGYQQGANMLAFQQQQQDRNALAKIAQAYATGGPQAARDAAGQLGQYDATIAADKTLYGRGRDDAMDARDARNFGYRQQRDTVGDKQWQSRFNAGRSDAAFNRDMQQRRFAADQNYRGTMTSLAQQKAAAKSGAKRGAGKPTVDSAKAAGFYDRMVASEQALSDPRNIEAAMDRGNLAMDAAADLTRFRFGAGYLPKEYQKFNQAQRDFINATLRRESGAVISEQEFENARLQYFPQPGDTPEVIAQKAQNRAIVIDGMRRSGEPSFEEETQAPEQASPAQSDGDQVIDYQEFFKD